MEDGGWWRTFLFFKFINNNMVYSLDIYVFLCKRNPCRTKVLWVLKCGEVRTRAHKNQNHHIQGTSLYTKNENSPEYCDFGFFHPVPNFSRF